MHKTVLRKTSVLQLIELQEKIAVDSSTLKSDFNHGPPPELNVAVIANSQTITDKRRGCTVISLKIWCKPGNE